MKKLLVLLIAFETSFSATFQNSLFDFGSKCMEYPIEQLNKAEKREEMPERLFKDYERKFVEEKKYKFDEIYSMTSDENFVITQSEYRQLNPINNISNEKVVYKHINTKEFTEYNVNIVLYYLVGYPVPFTNHYEKLKNDLKILEEMKPESDSITVYSSVSPEGLKSINKRLLKERPKPLVNLLKEKFQDITFIENTKGVICNTDYRYCRKAFANIKLLKSEEDEKIYEVLMNEDIYNVKKNNKDIPLRIILPYNHQFNE